MSRNVVTYFLVLSVAVLGACLGASIWSNSAHAANGSPDCNDGVDNDGDGLIDFPQDNGCVSFDDNSELAGVGGGGPDAGAGVDGGLDGGGGTGTTDVDGGSVYTPGGGGSSTGTGTSTVMAASGGGGCDVGGRTVPTLPIVLVFALGLGLAITRRPSA